MNISLGKLLDFCKENPDFVIEDMKLKCPDLFYYLRKN